MSEDPIAWLLKQSQSDQVLLPYPTRKRGHQRDVFCGGPGDVQLLALNFNVKFQDKPHPKYSQLRWATLPQGMQLIEHSHQRGRRAVLRDSSGTNIAHILTHNDNKTLCLYLTDRPTGQKPQRFQSTITWEDVAHEILEWLSWRPPWWAD